ncbi:MAG: hypothetical protein M1837_002811 [Sclerophora amabilis]|nr:MAG: hypothetical protein M1837_002811 [Sclerophora amabilis]
MDPTSVAALVIAIGQVLASIYRNGKDAKDTSKEVNHLCSELFGLRSALEHLRMNLESCAEVSGPGEAPHAFSSPHVKTQEFSAMLSDADSLVQELHKCLERKPGRLNSVLYSLTFPLKKDDIKTYIQRLERQKTYFILTTTTDNLDLSRCIYLEVRSVNETLRVQKGQQDSKADAEFRRSVIRWLAPFDPSLLHQKALGQHHAETGKWFLDGPFREWTSEEAHLAVLWLRGKPGVGKTTLLSAAVNEMAMQASDRQHIASAYFYCSFTDMASQDPANIFGSFIVQMCELRPENWSELDARYRDKNSRGNGVPKRLGLLELQAILKRLCRSFSQTYLFLDAPNESKEPSDIMSPLLGMVSESEGLRLMVSSTEELDFQTTKQGLSPPFLVHMSTEQINSDVSNYIEVWLREHERLRNLPAALKRDIKSVLIGKADGMFRWVQCQLEALVLQKTPNAIRASLEGVPRTLEQTYSNMLIRIPTEDRWLAKQALFWLTFALRALDFAELCEAVVLNKQELTIEEDARLLRPEDILIMCRGLISYNSFEKHVVLAHSSVRTFLTSRQVLESEASYFFLDAESAHKVLTQKCLTYLSFSDFCSGYCTTQEDLDRRWERWPLLDYAAIAWPAHARLMVNCFEDLDEATQHSLLRFFKTARWPRAGNFGAWVQAFMPGANLSIENSTSLYYASRFDLVEVVKMLLAVEGTVNLEVRGGRRGSTPLHVASAFGNEEIVEILLAEGANAQEVNQMGETGLEWGVRYGSEAVVRRLLAAGADPNRRNHTGRPPLFYAMRKDDDRCMVALLEAGAELSAVEGIGLHSTDASEILRLIEEERRGSGAPTKHGEKTE